MAKAFKFKRGFKAEAERNAVNYREILNIDSKAPLPAKILADYLDIKVVTPSAIFPKNSNSLNTLSSSNNWSALTLVCKSGKRLIIHNDRHSLPRQESNIMHEIAHVLCKHESPNKSLLDGIGILMRDYNETQEKEAEWLGGCLQIPRDALMWSLKKKMNNNEIADFFNASVDMVTFRINTTGVQRQLFFLQRNFS